MNIVFVLQSLANGGGVERTITDKANYLAQQGHLVSMVTYEQGMHPEVFKLLPTINHWDLECRRFTLYKYPKYKQFYKLWCMKKLFATRWNSILNQIKPDIVVMTTYSDDFRKEILDNAKNKQIKIIIESHTAFWHDKQTKNIIKKLYLKYDLHLIRKCNLLLALTKGDAVFWRKHVTQVKVLPNPVTFYADDISNRKQDIGRIISVGRLDSPKRFDILIDAFSKVASKWPEWHLDIYGKGRLHTILERQIEKLGLQGRVIIHEHTTEMFSEYMRSQFFILCSEYEGFGLVIVEAMACGIPIISVNCPYGPAEIVRNGETGWLCKMDVGDLSERMEWMFSHEKERLEMGKNAHESAAKFRKESVMKEWEKAYLSVLSH